MERPAANDHVAGADNQSEALFTISTNPFRERLPRVGCI